MKIGVLKIILLVFILLTYGFQCDEGSYDDQFKNIYELDLPYKVFPVKKEYHINDTIQVSAIIKDRSLKEVNSQKPVEIKCTAIPVTFYVGVRESNFNELNSNDLFEILVDTVNFKSYQIENNGQFSKFESTIPESIFDKEEIVIMKLILKRTGIFMMDPFTYRDLFINRAVNCDSINPVFDRGILNPIFDVINSNPELLEESPLPHNTFISGDRVPDLTAEKRIFWLKVIE